MNRVFPGPCHGCGATEYGLSTSGPNYCGACACGTPPEVTRLRRELAVVSKENIDLILALQIAVDGKWFMTPEMRERGEKIVAEFKQTGKLPSR